MLPDNRGWLRRYSVRRARSVPDLLIKLPEIDSGSGLTSWLTIGATALRLGHSSAPGNPEQGRACGDRSEQTSIMAGDGFAHRAR